MIRMTLGEAAEIMGAELAAEHGGAPVAGVATDTRTLAPGEIFFAFDGERSRGSDHLDAAFAAGALAAVSPRPAPARGRVLVVPDVHAALLRLGAAVRSRLAIPVIAITGTNGKTTTKDALRALLAAGRRVVAAHGSFNNKIGVPLTICRADESTEALVLEIGTNAPGEIAMLGAVARPTMALITSIGPGHLEGLGGIDGVLREKLALADALIPGGWLFLNREDPRLAAAPLARERFGNLVWYGLGADATVRAHDPVVDESGVGFRFGHGGPLVRAALHGDKNLVNLLGACAVARACGLDDATIARGAAAIETPKMRMEVRHERGIEATFDCYNANPASMEAALDAWTARGCGGRRIAVLGDMLELGAAAEPYHAALGRHLARLDLAHVVLVGSAMAAAQAALERSGAHQGRIRRFADVLAASDYVRALLRPGDRVLLKGSRGVGLERLFEAPKAVNA
jgi:UDP-N-acetylmuramoyl-tripeptide--D-alanyl-D-alanine ligase